VRRRDRRGGVLDGCVSRLDESFGGSDETSPLRAEPGFLPGPAVHSYPVNALAWHWVSASPRGCNYLRRLKVRRALGDSTFAADAPLFRSDLPPSRTNGVWRSRVDRLRHRRRRRVADANTHAAAYVYRRAAAAGMHA
jgi:hypothetical protein